MCTLFERDKIKKITIFVSLECNCMYRKYSQFKLIRLTYRTIQIKMSEAIIHQNRAAMFMTSFLLNENRFLI